MNSKPKHAGLGIALGAALGAVFGVIAGHIGAWLAVGVAIGRRVIPAKGNGVSGMCADPPCA
jgi:hypothetical protein